MSWSALGSTYWVSGIDMNDAISSYLFKMRDAGTIPAVNGWSTKKDLIDNVYVDVDQGSWVPTVVDNTWPQKSWIYPMFLPECPIVTSSYNAGTSTMTYSFTLKPYVYNARVINVIRVRLVDDAGTEVATNDFSKPFTGTFASNFTSIPPGTYFFSIQYLDISSTVISDPCVLPVVVNSITGLASPTTSFFNPTDGLIYYTELDTMANIPAINGGAIGWFNPLTATTYSDFTYAGVGYGANSSVYNPANNCLYTNGYHSRGLVIFNCTTKATVPLAYEADNSFNNGNVYLVGNKVYAGYSPIQGFVVVDTTTNTRTTDFLPPSPVDSTDYFLLAIGTEAWVFYFNSTTTGDYAKCNIFTLSTLSSSSTPIATINNLSIVKFQNGRYVITEPVIDFDGTKLWYSAYGDSKIFSIDIATKAIVDSIDLPKGIKSYTAVTGIKHDQSQSIYFSGAQVNSATDAGDPITFRLNTAVPSILSIPGVSFRGKFTYCPLNGRTYGCFTGRTVYNTPNTGYDSDGSIQVYN